MVESSKVYPLRVRYYSCGSLSAASSFRSACSLARSLCRKRHYRILAIDLVF